MFIKSCLIKMSITFSIMLTAIIFIQSDNLEISFQDDITFDQLIFQHSKNYVYHNEESKPFIPSKRVYLELKNICTIDSINVFVSEIEIVKKDYTLSGENSLPLGVKQRERSVIKNQKSKYPEIDYDIKTGISGNKTIIYGYIADYYYENGNIYKRNGSVTIYYTVKPNANSEKNESEKFAIITNDVLKCWWDNYADFYPSLDIRIIGISEISAMFPAYTFKKGLREYLKMMYSDSNLIGTLLAGDMDVIPGAYVYMPISPSLGDPDQTLLTDKYYSCLDGDWDYDGDGIVGEIDDSIDIFPDILVGRVPVYDSTTVYDFIKKIDGFRKIENDTFVFSASNLDAYTPGSIHTDNMIKFLGITNPVIKLYETLGNLSSASFISALNNSPQFVSHDGHGYYNVIQTGTDYTDNDDISALTNSRPIMMYSLSCLSAGYDHDCIAERFVTAQNGGGYYIGNTRYGWYTPYFPGYGTGDLLNSNFVDKLLHKSNNPINALNLAISEFASEISCLNDYRWQFMTLNYFGDPLVSIELKKENIYLDVIEPIYKNGYLSMTVPVKDSVIVRVYSETLDTFFKLYQNANLISMHLDASDSIFISIKSGDIIDTTVVKYPDEYEKSVGITNYRFDYLDSDTIALTIAVNSTEIDTFLIKPLEKGDTLNLVGNDSIFIISGDTSIEYKFTATENPINSTLLPIEIDDDTLNIQFGINLSECLNISFIPQCGAYFPDDTAKSEFNMKNNSKYCFYNLQVTCESETLSADSLSTDKTLNKMFTMIMPDADVKTAILSVSDGKQSFSRNYKIVSKNSLSFYGFETNREMAVDSEDAYWHRSDNRAADGSWSYFSGYTSSATYPREYNTALYTDSFNLDTLGFISFDAYVDIEAGMDYLIVLLITDSDEVPVFALSGRNTGFKRYVIPASKFDFIQGVKARLAFCFFSDNDDYQYEGVYVDNISVPGNIVSTGFHESTIVNPNAKNDNSFHIVHRNMSNQILIYSNEKKNSEYSIYNIAGTLVENGIVQKGENILRLTLPSGKYFLNVKGIRSSLYKDIVILK